ncbi:serine/threonine-protein kinase SBK1 isoform X3 [Poecile atricapillus]|uniref:serine/threonine-protein kinase SBK1 isoform X3 n=1 Tax=Poecile atricapillus TaxID=48891 RepID=UPI002739CE95|nr:serine/threonine-protein kinase SBK1 isoform X3 [Poecile atricapillus]
MPRALRHCLPCGHPRPGAVATGAERWIPSASSASRKRSCSPCTCTGPAPFPRSRLLPPLPSPARGIHPFGRCSPPACSALASPGTGSGPGTAPRGSQTGARCVPIPSGAVPGCGPSLTLGAAPGNLVPAVPGGMAAGARGDTELGAESLAPLPLREPAPTTSFPLGVLVDGLCPQGLRGHPTRVVSPGLGAGGAGPAGAPRGERILSTRAAAPGVLRSRFPSLLPSAAASRHPRSIPGSFGSCHRSVAGAGGRGTPAPCGAQPLGSRSDRAMAKGQSDLLTEFRGHLARWDYFGLSRSFPAAHPVQAHPTVRAGYSTNPRGARGPSGRRGLFARFGIARSDKHV